ncbi:outer membrane beta-barrel protein [Endozoicomonas sp.]|uniref:outer membrane beta-barrel protein n=1 Tax=Endozoicomonas sp. TaxID=1892382 RepID=UPI002884AEDE|nr:outer membrane beta-barrel protein [Endozoicomonas sp.]
MKKITSLFTALAITAFSTVSAAQGWEDDWTNDDIFVGLEGGFAHTKVKKEGGTGFEDKDDKTSFYGLRVGSFWNDEARAYFTVSQAQPDDVKKVSGEAKGIKQLNLLVSADYLFMPEWEIQPFVGLTLGATENKADNYDNKWGFAYGVQGGVIYQIENIDLEAGLKYLGNSTDIDAKDNSGKLKVNDSRQVYVAASIHF